MRSINSLLDEYGDSHRHPTNKIVHWICVPVIFFSVVGFLYSVKIPALVHSTFVGDGSTGTSYDLQLPGIMLTPTLPLNLAMITLALLTLYYLRLSPVLAAGMTLFGLFCLVLCQQIEHSGAVLWQVSLVLFVVAWIAQFWGHKVEGKKPSFLKDLQFLLIGPAWLMSFLYQRAGINF